MKANRIRLEDAPDFFGPRDLGRIMGINEKAAYDLAHSQGFPTIRVGKKLIISKMGLIRWMGERGLA
ncbi:MAG: helix-turn-helix domain-containing protein [Thermoanaerobacter sp.]|nr:helix-turn-helix domain-containing protein [Thermoanaerobacter sp.]